MFENFRFSLFGRGTTQPMKIVHDSAIARIWCDDNAPYAFSVFFNWPTEEEFEAIASKYVNLMKEVKKKFGSVYSICDLSKPTSMPSHAMMPLFEACIEKQLKLGVNLKAFVLPKDFPKKLFTSPALLNSECIAFHETFETALIDLNKLRMSKTPVL